MQRSVQAPRKKPESPITLPSEVENEWTNMANTQTQTAWADCSYILELQHTLWLQVTSQQVALSVQRKGSYNKPTCRSSALFIILMQQLILVLIYPAVVKNRRRPLSAVWLLQTRLFHLTSHQKHHNIQLIIVAKKGSKSRPSWDSELIGLIAAE